jgi:hypothetical protein
MLIDELMPIFDFSETEQTEVFASQDAAFRAIKTLDMSDSTTIRWLFKMRGLPTKNLTLHDLEKVNIKVLAENPNEEILLGLIGEFKTLTGGLLDLKSEDFREFKAAGFIKATWNFAVLKIDESKTLVLSEIRVNTTDENSLAKVKKYWGLIKPPSAMIRQEILKLIKQQAEQITKSK